MLKFDKIKKLGKSPALVRTAEEFEERLGRMRRWTKGPINKFLSWLVQIMIAGPTFLYLVIFNKPKVHNRKILETIKPPYMFVSNHLTMFDDVFIDSLVYLPWGIWNLRYFPWHAPEEKNFFLGPVMSWILQKAQCVPLTRGHGVFQPGMTRLKELLQDEAIVHIFPEGTRSRSGDINRGQVGVGRLAYQSKCKVVPCYHEGTRDLLPIGSHRLRTGKRMEVVIGEPIDMLDLYEQEESRKVYQAIADRMIDHLRGLRKNLHDMGRGVIDLSDYEPGEEVNTESTEKVKVDQTPK
jgi:1-acyl-sn-glycerol-3-phosphate acyltransferase